MKKNYTFISWKSLRVIFLLHFTSIQSFNPLFPTTHPMNLLSLRPFFHVSKSFCVFVLYIWCNKIMFNFYIYVVQENKYKLSPLYSNHDNNNNEQINLEARFFFHHHQGTKEDERNLQEETHAHQTPFIKRCPFYCLNKH